MGINKNVSQIYNDQNDDIDLQSTSPHKNFTKQQTYSELPNLSKSTTLIKTKKSIEIENDEDIADDTPIESNEYVVNINKNVSQIYNDQNDDIDLQSTSPH